MALKSALGAEDPPEMETGSDDGMGNSETGRANAFESQFRENAPRRRISLSNRLKLVLKHP
jgi:hypothetical protein